MRPRRLSLQRAHQRLRRSPSESHENALVRQRAQRQGLAPQCLRARVSRRIVRRRRQRRHHLTLARAQHRRRTVRVFRHRRQKSRRRDLNSRVVVREEFRRRGDCVGARRRRSPVAKLRPVSNASHAKRLVSSSCAERGEWGGVLVVNGLSFGPIGQRLRGTSARLPGQIRLGRRARSPACARDACRTPRRSRPG